jgi:hypothetical protein
MFDKRMSNSRLGTVVLWLMLLNTLAVAQAPDSAKGKSQPTPSASTKPAEDISGMYSFLGDGEFVQINLEEKGVSGYISRRGELDSDRGAFLDQFFSKAAVEGHDVSFTTKPLHGVWFEFSGRFERGPAKNKSEDGYYILKGKLIQFTADANKSATSRSREVEFKLLGQPADDPEPRKAQPEKKD